MALEAVGFMKLRELLAVARRLVTLPPARLPPMPPGLLPLLDMRRVAVLVLTPPLPPPAFPIRLRSLAETLLEEELDLLRFSLVLSTLAVGPTLLLPFRLPVEPTWARPGTVEGREEEDGAERTETRETSSCSETRLN